MKKILYQKSFLTIVVLSITVVIAVLNVNRANLKPSSNPLFLNNMEAFADGNGGESGGTNVLWIRKDEDCVYKFSIGAYGTITILGGIKLKANRLDIASYTVSNGKTHCTGRGEEQCTARYCPTIPGSSNEISIDVIFTKRML
jgi:hypothetical protein